MHIELMATLLHPGDFSLGEWVRLIGMFVAFIILPIMIIGFIIFKVLSRRSGGEADGESQQSITLELNDSTRK